MSEKSRAIAVWISLGFVILTQMFVLVWGAAKISSTVSHVVEKLEETRLDLRSLNASVNSLQVQIEGLSRRLEYVERRSP